MKTMKILAIVCAVVFFLSLGLGVTFAVMAGGVEFMWDTVTDSDRFQVGRTASDTVNIPADTMTALKLDMDTADVTVLREEREDIEVSYTLYGQQFSHKEEKGKLEIEVRARNNRFWSGWREATVTIRVPAAFTGELEASLDAGVLKLQGHHEFRSAKLNLDAGTMQLDSLKTGQADIEASAGKVTAEKLEATSVDLDVDAGNATLKALTGTVKASVGAGYADLQFARLDGDVRVEVDMGGMTIGLPGEASANLDLTADLGKVTQEFGDRFDGSSSHSRIHGTVGGGGVTIKGEASAGSIRVYEVG